MSTVLHPRSDWASSSLSDTQAPLYHQRISYCPANTFLNQKPHHHLDDGQLLRYPLFLFPLHLPSTTLACIPRRPHDDDISTASPEDAAPRCYPCCLARQHLFTYAGPLDNVMHHASSFTALAPEYGWDCTCSACV